MPARRRTDPSQAMAEAEAALTRADVKFTRKTAFHLKVQAFNFWPSTGRFARDGDHKKADKHGLPLFIRMLRDAGLAKDQPLEAINDPDDFVVKVKSSEPGFETY